MEKNVKNWNLDLELFEMGRMVELVEYQVSRNNWGVEWYNLVDWLNSCGYSMCKKKLMYRLWVLNNRLLRYEIGVYDELSNEFVSRACMLGKQLMNSKGGINMQ